MVLPIAVAKSTGLRQALRALRISVHNTVAIGDAENDYDLLDACEVGTAVDWGSATLKAAADEVVPGAGPAAVAGYIRRLADQPRLSAAQMGRRRLLLGYEHNGAEVSLAVRGRTILVAGEPGIWEVATRRSPLRAVDPAGVLRLHCGSRRRLRIAIGVAQRHHAWRGRSATQCARARQNL